MNNLGVSPPIKGNFRNVFGSPRLGGLEFCLNQMALVTVKFCHLQLLPGDNDQDLPQCGLQECLEIFASVAIDAALYEPHELFSFSKCNTLLGQN